MNDILRLSNGQYDLLIENNDFETSIGRNEEHIDPLRCQVS